MPFNFTAHGAPYNIISAKHPVCCVRLDLFGDVSLGIERDALRISYMKAPAIPAAALEAKTPRQAAEHFYGLLKAEVSGWRLAGVRSEFADNREEFAAYSINTPERLWVGEQCLTLACEWALDGLEDEAFRAAVWQEFCGLFFAEVQAA